jgi:type II restriction/modification system DNA methylase subunit YeeA
MNKAERRVRGAHYTSEKNILKVIEPLFMEGLRSEFERLKSRRDTSRKRVLQEFHESLGALRFFDPACGCGNFLVIAYRELRELEIDILRELYDGSRLMLPLVNVDQYFGIDNINPTISNCSFCRQGESRMILISHETR